MTAVFTRCPPCVRVRVQISPFVGTPSYWIRTSLLQCAFIVTKAARKTLFLIRPRAEVPRARTLPLECGGTIDPQTRVQCWGARP